MTLAITERGASTGSASGANGNGDRLSSVWNLITSGQKSVVFFFNLIVLHPLPQSALWE